jgi:hypothetical protein
MANPPPYPDAEQVGMDLHRHLAPVVSWLPPDPQMPIIWVQRIGGGPDEWDQTDYAMVRVHYYHETRNQAMNLAKAGESVVLGMKGKTVHHDVPTTSEGVLIDYSSLDVGPISDPDLEPDERRVSKTYTLGMRRQYHLLEA